MSLGYLHFYNKATTLQTLNTKKRTINVRGEADKITSETVHYPQRKQGRQEIFTQEQEPRALEGKNINSRYCTWIYTKRPYNDRGISKGKKGRKTKSMFRVK